MKAIKILCVIALAFAFTASAYAETQSVKISGDITMRGFARHNFDLEKGDPENNNGTQSSDWAQFLMTQAEFQIDADLTDNVSGVIRLVNQRMWGDNLYTSNGELQGLTYNGIVTGRNKVAANNSYNVD